MAITWHPNDVEVCARGAVFSAPVVQLISCHGLLPRSAVEVAGRASDAGTNGTTAAGASLPELVAEIGSAGVVSLLAHDCCLSNGASCTFMGFLWFPTMHLKEGYRSYKSFQTQKSHFRWLKWLDSDSVQMIRKKEYMSLRLCIHFM